MSKRIIRNIIILLCVLALVFFILVLQGKISTPLNGLSIILYTPKQFYSPYSQSLIKENVYKYKLNYIHKFVGDHSIILNVVNNTPKEFDYDNPDRIDLSLSVDLNTADNKTNTLFRFDKKLMNIFCIRELIGFLLQLILFQILFSKISLMWLILKLRGISKISYPPILNLSYQFKILHISNRIADALRSEYYRLLLDIKIRCKCNLK